MVEKGLMNKEQTKTSFSWTNGAISLRGPCTVEFSTHVEKTEITSEYYDTRRFSYHSGTWSYSINTGLNPKIIKKAMYSALGTTGTLTLTTKGKQAGQWKSKQNGAFLSGVLANSNGVVFNFTGLMS